MIENFWVQGVRPRSGISDAHIAGITGRGVGIAVMDTGVCEIEDITKPQSRFVAFVDMINGRSHPYDDNGHGTHVAGIAAGNGVCSEGKYAGIAPAASIVGLKVMDEQGGGNVLGVVRGLQWVLENRERYNIRIANLSVGTYDLLRDNLMVCGVEQAWDAGIVVVVAAGNSGPGRGTVMSPGVSRKVITVGSSDDHLDANGNGFPVGYSSRGPTRDCIIKPDIIAPGTGIVSCLSHSITEERRNQLKDLLVGENYLRLSGTSMATPVVSGAIALLLERQPWLSPDDVKLRLKHCAIDTKKPANAQGWGLLDINRLLQH